MFSLHMKSAWGMGAIVLTASASAAFAVRASAGQPQRALSPQEIGGPGAEKQAAALSDRFMKACADASSGEPARFAEAVRLLDDPALPLVDKQSLARRLFGKGPIAESSALALSALNNTSGFSSTGLQSSWMLSTAAFELHTRSDSASLPPDLLRRLRLAVASDTTPDWFVLERLVMFAEADPDAAARSEFAQAWVLTHAESYGGWWLEYFLGRMLTADAGNAVAARVRQRLSENRPDLAASYTPVITAWRNDVAAQVLSEIETAATAGLGAEGGPVSQTLLRRIAEACPAALRTHEALGRDPQSALRWAADPHNSCIGLERQWVAVDALKRGLDRQIARDVLLAWRDRLRQEGAQRASGKGLPEANARLSSHLYAASVLSVVEPTAVSLDIVQPGELIGDAKKIRLAE